MAILSTREVCEKLDVSRAWVNVHLRELGGMPAPTERNRANLRTIYYDENDILSWIRRNAIYTRQTKRIDLCKYMEESVLEQRLEEIRRLPENYREAAFADLLLQMLPRSTVEDYGAMHARARGRLPWVTADSFIASLDELRTMKQLQQEWECNSPESVYRSIFNRAMIKVEVAGRCWYMADPDDICILYGIVVPAGAEV